MTPEGYILDAIMDYLAAVHVTAFRMNVGAMKLDNRYVAFGVRGMADILAIPTVSGVLRGVPVSWTLPWFIECKSAIGKQTPEQRSFENQVVAAGAEYLVARSVDDVERWLVSHGALKEHGARK